MGVGEGGWMNGTKDEGMEGGREGRDRATKQNVIKNKLKTLTM